MKGDIVIDVPDSMDSVTIGCGTNFVSYDGVSPIELDDTTAFHITFDPNSTEEPTFPFKFCVTIINLRFNYKGA